MSIPQMPEMDWMLEELASQVPHVQHIVALSADGLCIGKAISETDAADRIAAACSGLQSLAKAIASFFPSGDGTMKFMGIEVDNGYFALMNAGEGARLAVLADVEVDVGLLGDRMRALVVRIGAHMTSPPRDDIGQAG